MQRRYGKRRFPGVLLLRYQQEGALSSLKTSASISLQPLLPNECLPHNGDKNHRQCPHCCHPGSVPVSGKSDPIYSRPSRLHSNDPQFGMPMWQTPSQNPLEIQFSSSVPLSPILHCRYYPTTEMRLLAFYRQSW